MTPRKKQLTTVDGQLDHITYFNPQTHYTIARVRTGQSQTSSVTALGYMPGILPGQTLTLTGEWETHPRFGQQFKVHRFEVALPATLEGQRKYLASGLIRGIGPQMADRLIRTFGADTLAVIENQPERLLEVEGIGPAKCDAVRAAWRQHHAAGELMKFLLEMGIQSSHAALILKHYGVEALDIVRKFPYRLALEVPAIGFPTIDRLAVSLGQESHGSQRCRAFVLYTLQRAAEDGHTFIYENQLEEIGGTRYQMSSSELEAALDELAADGDIVLEEIDHRRAVFRVPLHRAEVGLARRLGALLSFRRPSMPVELERAYEEVRNRLAIDLSSAQLEILKGVLSHRLAIITGGPGTGKTTLLRSLTVIFELAGNTVELVAPTGRAARRLSGVCRREAKTIHRMLGFNFSEDVFQRNQDNPVDADVVIVDEASMVDTLVMHRLIQAIPLTGSLILVGDVYQLPSVGPGNVLADLILSQQVPVFYLNEIFRQARESPIVVQAHGIRRGEALNLEIRTPVGESDEFVFLEEDSAERMVAKIVNLCQRDIPERYGFDPRQDLQVITPMHKGLVGTIHLNQVLQKTLNPGPTAVDAYGQRFKVGDKVMHLKNNYQKDVYNGDIGTLQDIDKEQGILAVNYDGRLVHYDANELDELTVAYAITVHKSQGSEYPAVIVPLAMQHAPLLQRNILYTAVTRGQQLVILIGSRRAFATALANDRPHRRRSGLAARLQPKKSE